MSKGKNAGGSGGQDSSKLSSSAKQSKQTKSRKSRVQPKHIDGGWFTLRNLFKVIGSIVVLGIAIVVPIYGLKYSHFTSALSEPKVIDDYLTNQTDYKQRLWGSYR